ncbi:MAG: histidine kinase [Fibrobacteraceae bacterium]|nr:histidine kinase [Fibrobacteraceae bacterium]
MKNFIEKYRSWYAQHMQTRMAKIANREESFIRDLRNMESPRFPIPTVVPIVLAWSILILFPLIFLNSSPDKQPLELSRLLMYFIPIILSAIVFSINQRFLVGKLFLKKRYFYYVISNVGLLLFLIFIKDAIDFVARNETYHGWKYFFTTYCFSLSRQGQDFGWLSLVIFVLVVVVVCFVSVLFKLSTRQILIAFLHRDQERNKLQYELDFLKNQLSPHFLFNTLNNISALIQIDPKRAEKSMNKLSSLLRVMLYQTADETISVKDDVDILEKYADLEKLRLPENFDLQINVQIENNDFKIAPLIVMPLVENAMKHSLNPKEKCFAHIFIEQKENTFTFISRNTFFPRKSSPKASGLGLSTFRNRLDLIYMGRYRYEAGVKDGVYECKLVIG